MCAILDANVVNEVLGDDKPEAAMKFYEWIRADPKRLVIGGRLRYELGERASRQAKRWINTAIKTVSVCIENDEKVDNLAERLQDEGKLKSDDPHVVALAQVSGARLLYSRDKDLHSDFTNSNFLRNPRGRVYSTLRGQEFTNVHESLLKRKDLCRGGCTRSRR